MAAPTVTPLPPAPARNVADPETYIGIADTWAAALPTFGAEVQAAGEYANTKALASAASAAAALASQGIANTKAGEASDSAAAALESEAAAAASEAVALGAASTAAGFTSTSSTSMALTAGSKTITIQTNRQLRAGDNIKVKRTSAPTTTYAHTTIDTYDTATGELTFALASDRITGSGTYSDWTVTLSGDRGATGPEGTVPQGVYSDMAAAFIYIAELTGTAAGMSAGVADAFEDQTGVDGAGSTNEVYDGTNDLYYNSRTTYSTDQPIQTSNSAPSGYVTSASSTQASGVAAFYAFDQDNGTNWQSLEGAGLPQWVKRQFPSVRRATGYSIRSINASGYRPTAWTLAGSNDDSSWTTLDSRTGQSLGSSTATYSIASPGSFTHYRLTVTASDGNGLQVSISELLLTLEAYTAFDAMSLRSVAYTAVSTPTIARFTVAADLNGGAVNTDLIAYASRDNGTTWTAVTLTAGRTLGDGTTVYEGQGSIATQPSGTSMKWRMDTTDDYDVAVSSVVFQWS